MERNATVVFLSDRTKALLKLMHWGDIPEEAKYVAFTEDGMAQYFEEFKTPGFLNLGVMTFVQYYPNITLEITE